jgi:alanyl-tRNA synthetase
MNDLRALAKELRLLPGAIGVLASQQAGESSPVQVQIVVACAADSGLRAQELLKPLLAQINGKGGGDASLAQGGGLVAQNSLDALFSLARAIVVDPGATAG